MKRKLKGRHFSLHVRFSSGDFNVAYCVLCSRGMYSLHNTWYWVIMSVLFFVFTGVTPVKNFPIGRNANYLTLGHSQVLANIA